MGVQHSEKQLKREGDRCSAHLLGFGELGYAELAAAEFLLLHLKVLVDIL